MQPAMIGPESSHVVEIGHDTTKDIRQQLCTEALVYIPFLAVLFLLVQLHSTETFEKHMITVEVVVSMVVLPVTVLSFPRMRSQLHWCLRASGASRAYAMIYGPEGFATMLTCVWFIDKMLANLVLVWHTFFAQQSLDAPLLWIFLADLINVYVIRMYCIPAGKLSEIWRFITTVRLLGVAYCLYLPIDWSASLRSSAPLVCVTPAYGVVLFLRREYLVRRSANQLTEEEEPGLDLHRNEDAALKIKFTILGSGSANSSFDSNDSSIAPEYLRAGVSSSSSGASDLTASDVSRGTVSMLSPAH